MMKSAITPMRGMVRAHVWGPKGYSSKTFATVAEAQGWITIVENRK